MAIRTDSQALLDVSIERLKANEYTSADTDRIFAWVASLRKFLDNADLESSKSLFSRSDITAAFENNNVKPLFDSDGNWQATA